MGNRAAGLGDLRPLRIGTRQLWAFWQMDYILGASTLMGGTNCGRDDIDIQVVGIMKR
ncbi:MAG TPA: hypothetical protein VFI64_05865 [Nitrososphaeraceae archaeon]|nr:hypothetical protein [Nitrososphaeraceae archaeon]